MINEVETLPVSIGWWPRLWWGCLVVGCVFGLMFWADGQPTRWEMLGVSPLATRYADTVAVLAAGEAHAAGFDPYVIPNRFDPYGRPHVYGPGWLILGRMNLTVADARWLGPSVVMMFLIGVVSLFVPTNVGTSALIVSLLVSPPVLLGLNRANNDLIVLLMCLVAGWLIERRETVAKPAVMVLVGVAALLKFYPLALMPALLVLPGGLYRHVSRQAWLFFVIVAATAVQWGDYLKAVTLVPSSESIFNYHAARAVELLTIIFFDMPMYTWPGAVIAVALASLWIWRGRSGWWMFLPTTGSWGFLTVSSVSVWVACLSAGPNFSYRIIWLLPLAAWAWHRRQDKRYSATAFLGILITLAWAWLPKEWIASWFRENPSHWDGLLMNAVGFEQVFVLASFTVCLWMLMGWFWRRGKELIGGAEPQPPDLAA